MDNAIADALGRFVAKHGTSQKLYESAMSSLPGGNTRTALHTAPFPIYMRKGQGHLLYDEDGNEYVDLVSELTAGLFGHSEPRLQSALTEAIHENGLHLGASSALEQQYASAICSRFGLERLRFTNSGTEANIHCLAAARAFTGRRKIIAFRGGYHGGVLGFAKGPSANNIDQSDFIVLQYNDVEALDDAFKSHTDIAAVVMEAIQGSAGFIPASSHFLKAVRESTRKAGSLLIIDEVITSRLGPGGLTGELGLEPDLMTLGKWLGGGMPFGAFGGRQEILAVFDPRGSTALSHSGTFQNNVMMLKAGSVGLSQVYTAEAARDLNERGESLKSRLVQVLEGTRFCMTGRGSLMCIHATTTGLDAEKINCKDDILGVEDTDLKRLFWMEMINAGYWVTMRGSIALNLPTPSSSLDAFVEAVEGFCVKYRQLISRP